MNLVKKAVLPTFYSHICLPSVNTLIAGSCTIAVDMFSEMRFCFANGNRCV